MKDDFQVKSTINSFSDPTEERKKAKGKAMKLLAFSDRTEKALTEKLKECGFSEDGIRFSIEQMKTLGYLDDVRFCENYIRSHHLRKSRFEMREYLKEKGASESDIEAAFSEQNPDDRETVTALFLKKYAQNDLSDPKTYQKALRYFEAHGFRYEDVKKGLKDAISEPSDLYDKHSENA